MTSEQALNEPHVGEHVHTLIIGSGFGGSMSGLTLARAYKQHNKDWPILMLERGTWWTTPVGTVQDRDVKTAEFLETNKQPFQFWLSLISSSARHSSCCPGFR